MKKKTLIFLLLRIIAYIVISISYTKHGTSLWILFVLFFVIELNFWITIIGRKRMDKNDKETKKLLEDTVEKLKNN